MINFRLRLMIYLYEKSSKIYAALFKPHKKPWGIRKEQFADYPEGSLGKALGDFYEKYGFDVMPKLENHDVFHVLTNTGTEIQDEIAMQYLLLGNGKVSLYLLGMVSVGLLIYPEFWNYYMRSYQKGKHWKTFHNIEFKHLLQHSLAALQLTFACKSSVIHS